MKNDCLFISMRFMYDEIPKDKKFLSNYFRGPKQQAFLRYVIFFGDYINFRDHTGFCCQDRWLKILFTKYNRLLELYIKLKDKMDLENLSRLSSGKVKFGFKNHSTIY